MRRASTTSRAVTPDSPRCWLRAAMPRRLAGCVLYDHEEVGSRSAQGAASDFLRSCLQRLSGDSATDFHRAIAKSFLISADMAHGVHPNYTDVHEPKHQPLLGGGPVVKINVNQSYATDGESWAGFERWAAKANVEHAALRRPLRHGMRKHHRTDHRSGARHSHRRCRQSDALDALLSRARRNGRRAKDDRRAEAVLRRLVAAIGPQNPARSTKCAFGLLGGGKCWGFRGAACPLGEFEVFAEQ